LIVRFVVILEQIIEIDLFFWSMTLFRGDRSKDSGSRSKLVTPEDGNLTDWNFMENNVEGSDLLEGQHSMGDFQHIESISNLSQDDKVPLERPL
jgi:hypothetical protein